MNKKQGIKIEGYTNTWSAIDTNYFLGKKVYLMENDTHGDMSQMLVIDDNNDLIIDNVFNGFSDLEQIEIYHL